MSQGTFRITKDSVGWGLVCLWHLQKECTSLHSALLNVCAVSTMQMPQHLCVSSLSSGGGHFSCKVIWCPPVFHTPPFCRWLLQELVGTNYRGTHAIYCHLVGFFIAWKWKAISGLSLKLRKAHYKHLGRNCENIWMLREKCKNEHGFSVARSYWDFTCVKCHKYFPFSYLFPFL